MTRIEAEQLAMTKSRNDKFNNYVAEAKDWNGKDWHVVAYPVHRRDRIKSGD